MPSNFSKYQQVPPLHLHQEESKLIYSFISSKLIFFCDIEQRFILNSVSFLILSNILNISGPQRVYLFSCDLVNWLFTSLFKPHKILRGDLERLPIHTDYSLKTQKFNEELYLARAF